MNKGLTDSIQLNWLRTFEAAARHLSFTLASEELHMSQSAVSQQIQLLEHHVSQKLFVRANRAIQLSDAGRAFLPLVQDALQKLNEGAVQIFSPLNASVVDVSVNTSFSVLWLATHILKFSSIYPQISVRQTSNNWETDFTRSTAEIEIRYGTGNWHDFESTRLITPKLRPYCSHQNAKRLRSPADLGSLALLDVVGTKQGWQDWLLKMDLSSLSDQPRHSVDSHASAVSMAADGFGICLMYDEVMQEGVFAQQLVAPFIESVDTEGSYYLCCRRGVVLSDASRLFYEWLFRT